MKRNDWKRFLALMLSTLLLAYSPASAFSVSAMDEEIFEEDSETLEETAALQGTGYEDAAESQALTPEGDGGTVLSDDTETILESIPETNLVMEAGDPASEEDALSIPDQILEEEPETIVVEEVAECDAAEILAYNAELVSEVAEEEESAYTVLDADLVLGEDTYFTLEYEAEEDCLAYVSVYDEDEAQSASPAIEECIEVSAGEGSEQVPFSDALPSYFIIRAYLADPETGESISDVYENVLYTKAFVELKNSVSTSYPEERTVEFSQDSFGVFSKDTVVIYGDGNTNIMEETSSGSGTYTIKNADSQADVLAAGCELAYFYDGSLSMILHVTEVSGSGAAVTVTTTSPALEEVFEYLKIEEDTAEEECVLDLSGLPEGVTYMGTSTGRASARSLGSGVETASETLPLMGADQGYSELQETKTTLSLAQEYKLTSYKFNDHAEVSGNVSVSMDMPVRLYIAQSRQMLQYDVNVSVAFDGKATGSGEVVVPLGQAFMPILNGIMSLKVYPAMVLKAEGSVSCGVSATGSIRTQADNENGFRVLSKNFESTSPKLEAAGTLFVGARLASELFIVPCVKLLEADVEVGTEMSATMRTPIPEAQQQEGDHICQSCIDGAGNVVVNLKAEITAFSRKMESSTSFKLKGFEFYYSIDHLTGGRGECPYVKGAGESGDTGETGDTGESGDTGENGNGGGAEEEPETGWAHKEVLVGDYVYQIRYNDAAGICTIEDTWIYNGNFVFDGIYYWGFHYESSGAPLPATYTIPQNVGGYKVTKYVCSRYMCYGEEVEHLTIPSTVKLNGQIYLCFPNVRTVTIESKGATIYDEEFEFCNYLETVTIPDDVTYIGENAFSGCSSLKSIVIPNSVMTIGKMAFRDCSSLKSITIPDNVTNVGYGAFEDCSSLTEMTIGKNVEIDCQKWGCEDTLESVIMSEGRTEVNECAFVGCIDLRSVKIPNSVTNIGDSAFWRCSNLTEMIIGNSAEIDCRAWMCEETLESVILSEGRTEINEGAFASCTSLKEINIPDGVEIIESYAFSDCTNLKEVNIPDGVETIDGRTFSYCTSLKTITIPNSVTSIGSGAFGDCSNLTEMTIGNKVEIDGLSWGCAETLESVILTEGRTEINALAFAFWPNLKTITIPDGLDKIDYRAFEGCSNLTSIVLPESVTNIGRAAFLSCSNLVEIIIGKNVPIDIKNWGLSGNIETVILSEGRTKLDDDAFYGCTKLKRVVIPEELKTIGDRVFRYCYSLTSVTIPENVTSIGDRAFEGCSSLTNVTIPESVTSIGDSVFASCGSLTSVTIPESVTSIGDRAFWDCLNLTSITLPENLTSIGASAFAGCSNLTSVTIPNKVTSIGASAFGFDLVFDEECFPHLKLMDNFIIYGYSGSAAENYALGYGITFVPIDGTGQPGIGQPGSGQAGTTQPGGTQPSPGQSGTTQPGGTQTEPTVTGPGAPQTNPSQPETGQGAGTAANTYPVVGTTATVGSLNYKVTTSSSGSRTVTFTAPSNKKITKAAIPATVKINGYTYNVTEIAAKAFQNCKKLKSVTIGTNIPRLVNRHLKAVQS